mgnify:CR=1 FL=1
MRCVSVAAFCVLAVVPMTADAQIRMRTSEAQKLRSASALESRGDYQGAEEVLRELLEEDPSSSGGLFALERVLRNQGEIIRILPAVNAFLAEDPASSGVRYLELRVLTEVDSLDAVRREAEAWLAGMMYDSTRGRSCLGIFDAAALEDGPVCRLWLKTPVPHGLHGCWSPELAHEF